MTGKRVARLPCEADSLDRVTRYLSDHGLADRALVFEDRSTRTSQLAAEAVGCELGQIVKSLLFIAGDRPVLVLVAGDRRGDVNAIAAEMDAGEAFIGDAEAVREATGYTIGGVSPFDLPPDLTVLVDDSLQRFDILYAAAGTPNSMVPLAYDTLLQLSGGRVARISR